MVAPVDAEFTFAPHVVSAAASVAPPTGPHPIAVATEDVWRTTVAASGTGLTYVVDFYADWCGPCKAVAPQFNALAAEHGNDDRTIFVKVDVDNLPAAAEAAGVSGMPTFQVWRDGRCVASLMGANVERLRAMVKRWCHPAA